MTDPYAYWRAMLAHKADPKLPLPDFDVKIPPTGFWRNRRGEAVATWWQGDKCLAQVHTPNRTGGGFTTRNHDKTDVISDLMAYCVRSPINHETYRTFVKSGGVWPEDVILPERQQRHPTRQEGSREYYAEDRADQDMARSINENPPGERISDESRPPDSTQWQPEITSPEQTFSTEIDAVIASAEAYLNEIGRKITEKVHADRVANYSILAGQIATRAENAREAEKRPILEAGRACDARWKPIVGKAEAVTKNLKTILVPYFNKQREKAFQEAADAQKAREAATLAGETPPLAGARPSPTTAGTQGRIYLKGQKVYRITDLRAASAFISSLNQPPQEFVDGVHAAAVKLIKAGVEVPGAEVKTEDTVA